MEIAFDILTFLDDCEIPYKTSGRNVSRGWVEITCPFCDDPSTHLGINLDSKLFHCWICGSKGGPKKLIKYLLNCNWGQAEKLIKQFTDWTLTELIGIDDRPKKLKLPAEFNLLTPNTIPTIVSDYLLNRNFNPDTIIRRYNLYYPGPLGKYKLRLIIPILVKNRIVNFVGRDITGKTNRYRNCPNDDAEIPLNSLLYGIEEVPEGESIILVEGLFDKWRLGYRAVAMFGPSISSEQTLLIKNKKPGKVFILLDPDMPDTQYEKIASKLWFTDVEAIQLDFKGDPADLSPDKAKDLMGELF